MADNILWLAVAHRHGPVTPTVRLLLEGRSIAGGADNTVLNAGSGGDTIATDDVAGVKYQIIKIADGTDQGTGLIAGDATNGLDVDVTRLPALVAGTANIGDVDVLTIAAGDNNIGNVDVVTLPALVAGTANIGDVDVLTVPAPLNVTGTGVELGALRVTIATDSTGLVSVDDNAGSLTVDNTDITAAATSLAIMDDWDNTASDGASVSGDVAHDAADAGEPVKVGGVAVSGSASPTSVAAADRTRWIFNQHGIPYTIAGHPNLICREYDVGAVAQTDLNLAAALVAADERIYVTLFSAMLDEATTVGVSVRAGFGTASVPTASATGVSGMIASHPGLVPGGGFVVGSGSGIIAVGAAGEEPRLTSEAATSGNLHVTFHYFLIDETP